MKTLSWRFQIPPPRPANPIGRAQLMLRNLSGSRQRQWLGEKVDRAGKLVAGDQGPGVSGNCFRVGARATSREDFLMNSLARAIVRQAEHCGLHHLGMSTQRR